MNVRLTVMCLGLFRGRFVHVGSLCHFRHFVFNLVFHILWEILALMTERSKIWYHLSQL